MAKKIIQTDFHYIKTSNYKTHYANGIFGGLTPRGEIQMDFFIERQVIPQIVTHEIADDKIGKVVKTEGKKGFVREIEVGVIMNIETALAFQKWLNDRIDTFKKAQMAMKQNTQEGDNE